MYVRVGDYQGIGIPVKLSRSPGSIRTVPRDYAADTNSVLGELGYSAAEIAALVEDGSVRPAGSLASGK